jgi:predicted helicase
MPQACRSYANVKSKLESQGYYWGIFMNTIHSVLAELRSSSLDERDKGAKFEALTKKWLELSPEYSTLYDKVWFYGEWAKEQGIDQNDVGIDLVARNAQDQSFVAIQCKFYADTQVIEKRHIDSFFTALNKKHFVSGVIVTIAKKWSKLADEALLELSKPVFKVGVHQFEAGGVDWSDFALGDTSGLRLAPKKQLRPHQESALQAAVANFEVHDRGKLIMACGSGKTYTSLKIAEGMVAKGGKVLFLVPSIALLSQSLSEWKTESKAPMNAYAVCSDSRIGKSKEYEDISYTDLAYHATTNPSKLVKNFRADENALTVVFSTYQSIDVIIEAQKNGLPEFDLIICDEAHRTTGVKLSNVDESAFVKIHDQGLVLGKKRMYMTATPRIYGEQVKQKAQEADALLASMDDESIYGPEFYLLTFGQAVAEDLLSDYKVLVLAVSEEHVSRKLQGLLARDGELDIDDVTKIVGCYNGLRKLSTNRDDFTADPKPMRTAIAFSRSIKESKQMASQFQVVTQALADEDRDTNALKTEADHVDGTFNMEQRLDLLDWLKDAKTENTVRILSNARCLSEGIDVPALDAVLFMNPRDSQVDVVQSIGRVMRKAPGKQYGYVILPVVVKAGVSAEDALSDSRSYRTVWQVLQALRAHDSRFDAIVNKLELTGDAGPISVIGVGFDDGENESLGSDKANTFDLEPLFTFDDLHDAIFAKLVQKVGQRAYWETWAKDIGVIAKSHVERITALVDGSEPLLLKEFQIFVKGLQDNLNPSVTPHEAIEMLAQHLITQPVFDALFSDYTFSKSNVVSQSMQKMLDALERENLSSESEQLDRFYESVRLRASGISDSSAKQRVVKELYEKFFKLAFPDTSDRLGIVYTPIEIVDFIIHSSDEVLKKEFGSSISDEGVSILDPFTGTGTFIVRLLQSGLINPADLERKYRYELHANEIVLLAYYVAAINIEETYHSLDGSKYEPFNGVVLTDTFQMHEESDRDELAGFEVFPENNERVIAQKNKPIRVIIGNPPYSVGQSSANDVNANFSYPTLDRRITETYAAEIEATNKSSLYDSYIRAIRWASDRIEDNGLIAFVTNNGFIDSNTAGGLRKTLVREFSKIYVLNFRGNSRMSGEDAKREGGNVFDIRVGVSVVVLVRKAEPSDCEINYFEFPDYATKDEKLTETSKFRSLEAVPWERISPNEAGDWINQRSSSFESFIPLGNRTKSGETAVFCSYSQGLQTNRDAWVYNFSKFKVEQSVSQMLDVYNSEVDRWVAANKPGKPEAFIDKDPTRISWSRGLIANFAKGKHITFKPDSVMQAAYRPFCLQNVYSDPDMLHLPSILKRDFAGYGSKQFGFVVSGVGAAVPFSALMVRNVPDMSAFGAQTNSQFFPRYFRTQKQSSTLGLFDEYENDENITDDSLRLFEQHLGISVSADDLFFYTYGLLNHPGFKREFQNDLKRSSPRVPILREFAQISRAGRLLSDLHLEYETLVEYPLNVSGSNRENKVVTRMSYVKTKSGVDKTKILVNEGLLLSDIPISVQEYQVGPKSALDWVIDRYKVNVDKASGIQNDPNDWGRERGDTDYVVALIGRIVTMSLETLRIISEMPELDFSKITFETVK